MPTPGLVIAAPGSGSGKTLVTLALLRAFARAGLRVGSCKVGPDYIDPAFHAAASGRPCRTLDPWAMRPATAAAVAEAAGRDADLLIVEGVMGLFDGAADGTGTTADLAAAFGWPVVLVLDVQGQGATAAAVALGLRGFRPDVAVAGVIANRVGGANHAALLRRAFAPHGPPLLGCLPRRPELVLPSRHLGLVQACERPDLDAFLDRAADWAAEHLELDALSRLARPTARAGGGAAAPIPPLGQRIALAADAAFAFAYRHVLDGWRAAGAEIRPFSPLADAAPDAAADAVYLPGGYPELHAGRLAANRTFLDGLRAAAGRGAAVYGECGGHMVLGEALEDGDGTEHAMAGLLPVRTSFADRRRHLGYRRARLLADTPLGPAGAEFRGHEFHYATVRSETTDAPLFRCGDAAGRDLGAVGVRRGTVMGSFLHLIDRA